MSIRVLKDNQGSLLNAFDYLMIFPDRADKVFCAMLNTMKGLLEMSVFPLEGANLGHWYVENRKMTMHFVAPQLLLLDEYQA